MTKGIKIVGLSIAMLAGVGALAACKGDGGGGSGGSGASSTSTNTTSGTSTATGCDGCWPSCFMDMMADCIPSGACTQATSGTTDMSVCYANGVKAHIGMSTTGASMTYYKADGSVCFTGDSVFTSTDVTATYKDGSGNVLLTDKAPLTGGAQTITCGGQSYTVDPASAACKACQANPGGSSTSCTTGTCTAP